MSPCAIVSGPAPEYEIPHQHTVLKAKVCPCCVNSTGLLLNVTLLKSVLDLSRLVPSLMLHPHPPHTPTDVLMKLSLDCDAFAGRPLLWVPQAKYTGHCVSF